MLNAYNITYIHPDRELLFEDISFSISKHDKVALIGNNGIGKSTLLQILAGGLKATSGNIVCTSKPFYIPQHFGQFDELSIANALQIETRLNALNEILDGKISSDKLEILKDDWNLQERCQEALSFWGLQNVLSKEKMASLSGGQKTKIFLAGIDIHQPDIILMDEPTNHLDTKSRAFLYRYIQSTTKTLVVVSHDRKLLDLLNPVYELDKKGISTYGGNYSFYREQKEAEEHTLIHQLEDKEKSLKLARKAERVSLERKQRQDVRGKQKKEKEGVSRIAMKKLRNQAESSSAKLKNTHSEKIGSIAKEVREARKKLPDMNKMKMNLDDTSLHKGKILVKVQGMNYSYSDQWLWKKPMNFVISSKERINITGENGSGKSTLVKLIIGELDPKLGKVIRTDFKYVYIDQDYSLIRNDCTIYEQAQQYNDGALQEHEIKIRLHRYLFDKEYWNKPCRILSGGEKMRLMLCCLMIRNHAPDIFVLDEPTNNLDIRNIEILTKAINEYKGTVIVISHDSYFLHEIMVNRSIEIS